MTGLRYIQVLLPLRLRWEPFYSCAPDASFVRGDRVRVAFAGKEYVGVVTVEQASVQAAGIGASKVKPVLGTAEGLARVTEEELEFWRQLADYYLCTAGEVYKAAYPSGKVDEEEVKARVSARLRERLEKKEEQIRKARREDTRARYVAERDAILAMIGGGPGPETAPEEIILSAEQTEAYSRIKEAFASRKPALLRGVTGSGKTEIYLKLARETLRQGKNVLFLVPEIALSRQLEDRTARFFPAELQVCHSGESLSRRTATASFIRRNPYLVLGTRSSVFLPHRDLGLVIVDEEHDQSYKQDNPSPRYNGREAAIMLANIFGAPVILGSATPSLESLYNCSAGRFAQVRLDKRYYDSPDADVEIIDTAAERRKNGMVGSFSRKLIERIRETLAAGGQVAILRERRSYSPVLQCQECGDIPKCPRCNVPYSLHRKADGTERLVCHYCGKVAAYSGKCPSCGGDLKPLGAGTQKIEEEAAALFPEARIARLDSDSAGSKSHEKSVIRDFSEGRTDILIGTRMVAKGFDFSGLSLVAVIQADSILGQQDFRADERGLQLLEQFRGRCGRRSEKGLFVVQTSRPGHPVYGTLAGTASEEDTDARILAERKAFGYPPYSRIVNIVIKDYNEARGELLARETAAAVRNAGLGPGAVTVGPFAPAMEMVAREHVRMVRVLLPKDRNLKAAKERILVAVESVERERKYVGHIALDVDPV